MCLLRLAALTAAASTLAAVCPATGGRAADGDWVTIKGQVMMTAAPTPKPIDVTTDKQHCLSKGPLVYEDLIVNPKSKGVRNVVVWLRPDSVKRSDPFPQDKIHPDLVKVKAKNHVVDQPCCQFVPRVVAAREGDTIEFRNSAPVNHNVNYNSDDEQFNTNQAPNTSKTTKPVKAQPRQVTFKCDIHPWMQGRAWAFDHPYFAITDADGKFEIKDAPAGDWRIVYWHEKGFHKGKDGNAGFPLVVKAGAGKVMELKPIEYELTKR